MGKQAHSAPSLCPGSQIFQPFANHMVDALSLLHFNILMAEATLHAAVIAAKDAATEKAYKKTT